VPAAWALNLQQEVITMSILRAMEQRLRRRAKTDSRREEDRQAQEREPMVSFPRKYFV
jgi:hypothetical protein